MWKKIRKISHWKQGTAYDRGCTPENTYRIKQKIRKQPIGFLLLNKKPLKYPVKPTWHEISYSESEVQIEEKSNHGLQLRTLLMAEWQSLSILLRSTTIHPITHELSADSKPVLASLEGRRWHYIKTNSMKEVCSADSWSIPLLQLTTKRRKLKTKLLTTSFLK